MSRLGASIRRRSHIARGWRRPASRPSILRRSRPKTASIMAKFAESPGIVQLIGQRLMTGQTLTDSNISLGQGVAAVVGATARTVGTVAGAAVAAPLTIVEQPMRKRQPTGTEVEADLESDRKPTPLTQ
ncbi:hypothetical protein ACOJBO_12380 [Rhizobium beringeri]